MTLGEDRCEEVEEERREAEAASLLEARTDQNHEGNQEEEAR